MRHEGRTGDQRAMIRLLTDAAVEVVDVVAWTRVSAGPPDMILGLDRITLETDGHV